MPKNNKPERDSPKFDINIWKKSSKKVIFLIDEKFTEGYFYGLFAQAVLDGVKELKTKIWNLLMYVFFWFPLTPSTYNFHVSIYNPVVCIFMYPTE